MPSLKPRSPAARLGRPRISKPDRRSSQRRDADVDTSWQLTADPEQRRGAAVAEHGIFAAGEHCGHPAATLVERWPADRIDAASDEMKAAGFAAVLDRAGAEAERQQLSASHDPVLPASEFPSLFRARIRH